MRGHRMREAILRGRQAANFPELLMSKEGVLPFGAFHVASAGIASSGPVSVVGECQDRTVTSLSVEAFGLRFELNDAQLNQLSDVCLNGIQLSYEAGYPNTGGRTVYVLLSKGFVSGVQQSMLVQVDESGQTSLHRIDGQTLP
jgi:hypothetical protein